MAPSNEYQIPGQSISFGRRKHPLIISSRESKTCVTHADIPLCCPPYARLKSLPESGQLVKVGRRNFRSLIVTLAACCADEVADLRTHSSMAISFEHPV